MNNNCFSFGMLFGTSGPTILGNMSTGKEVRKKWRRSY